MGCNNCSFKHKSSTNNLKSSGGCATCSSDKMNVYDWLSNMTYPAHFIPFDIIEVRFKNGRKHFYKNTANLTLSIGDVIAVEASPGHDIGVISLTGELVKLQLKKHNITIDSEEIRKVYRKATQKDLEVWEEARAKETETQRKGREFITNLNIKMKLSDVEYQGDGTKATFFYTADDRVDFRQLIKEFATSFGIRVEMKQVGLRQEAARLGGVGSCGRELCCSTWLTDFRKVNTTAARYQQLSLNPQKLAGQCGKLKCCLNYELDSYLDALKDFPTQEVKLRTDKGDAEFVKMDIFKGLMWYYFKNSEGIGKLIKLTKEQVATVVENNKNNVTNISLEDFEAELIENKIELKDDGVMQDSIDRFEKATKKNKSNKKRNKQKRPQENINQGVKEMVKQVQNQPKIQQQNQQQNQKKIIIKKQDRQNNHE
ncbi:MAG: regulatory iron-sulfur-containing complex subunit RicT [Flavobacteriaceae bacterium]|jgi:cell fate regulator YaaT (PSP1 superfamily)|nr:regulatory iron-sulfur-containing complex subunit RicT [Flavobacteriaceae bacterium]